MQIRPIEDADFAAVAALMRDLSLEFVVHDSPADAAAQFIASNDEAALRAYVASGIVYHVAIEHGQLAGFVAVRDCSHLYHLFVAKAQHGRGIARTMWDVARRQAIASGGDGNFTVNASNHAVAAYEAMGFVRSAPNQCIKGMFVNPMRLAASVPAFVGAP